MRRNVRRINRELAATATQVASEEIIPQLLPKTYQPKYLYDKKAPILHQSSNSGDSIQSEPETFKSPSSMKEKNSI